MRSKARLRAVNTEEEVSLRSLARSKKSPAEVVRRARLLVRLIDEPGLTPAQAGYTVGFTSFEAGRRWVERFNQFGLEGLQDQHRSGRPPRHGPEIRQALAKLASTDPKAAGSPCKVWTLECLQQAFEKQHGIYLAEGTIWKWIESSGLRWREHIKGKAKSPKRAPGQGGNP